MRDKEVVPRERQEQALLFGPLTRFGERDFRFTVRQSDRQGKLPEEVASLKEKLEIRTDLPFYNGPFINVEHIGISGRSIEVECTVTDNFSYVAAAYAFRGHQEDNPIRPLAVQTSVFSPGAKKLILRKRPAEVTDMAGSIDTFGGALVPGELDLFAAMQKRLQNKWGVTVPDEKIISTGVGYSDVSNVVCPFFMVELDEEQYQERRTLAREAMRKGEATYYEISLDNPIENLRKHLFGKRDITKCEAFSFYNVLYALSARGMISQEQVKELLDATRANITP